MAVLSLVGALALVGGAGASGAAEEKPLSKKAFVKQADKACRKADVAGNKLLDRFLVDIKAAEASGGNAAGDAALQSFIGEYQPVFEQMIASIGALPAPKADKKKVAKLLAAWRSEIDEQVAHPTKALTKDQALTSYHLSKALGLKVCSSPGLDVTH